MALEITEPPHEARAAQTVSSPMKPSPNGSSSELNTSDTHPFEFTGSGSEYFRIWIVNLLLTIVTLGIYSAWAKVRRQQYFYRNTRVAGAAFDYLGTPGAILKGRLLAFGLLIAYNVASGVSPVAGGIVGLVLLAMAPWLLTRSLRFKMVNSTYRNVRFHFRGSVWQAYRMLIMFPVAFAVTAILTWVIFATFSKNPAVSAALFSVLMFAVYGSVVPLAHYFLKRYQHGNAYFGQTPFSFEASAVDFFKLYLKAAGCMILGVIAIGVSVAISGGLTLVAGENGFTQALGVAYGLLAMYIFYMFFIAYFEGKVQNLVWNDTEIAGVRFESKVKVRELLLIHAVNLLLIVLTLGFYKPFATIRRIKYRVECMTLVPVAGSVEGILADHSNERIGAIGEEAGELFDVDVAL